MSLVVLIQGPSSYVEEQKKAWDSFDIIWSTWKGEENKYNKNDTVVYNQIPNNFGVQNITLQQKSTIEGIKKAKELNFKRVLKWRSDLIPNNPKKLIDLFDKNSVNFLAWHNSGGYFIDYFMESDIDKMYKIWDFNNINGPFPERIITDNIFEKGILNFNFILDKLNSDNEIYWIKRNILLSNYKNNLVYTINIM